MLVRQNTLPSQYSAARQLSFDAMRPILDEPNSFSVRFGAAAASIRVYVQYKPGSSKLIWPNNVGAQIFFDTTGDGCVRARDFV